MSILVNTIYTILTWIAAFVIGFGNWLGWALLAMALLQSFGVIWVALQRGRPE